MGSPEDSSRGIYTIQGIAIYLSFARLAKKESAGENKEEKKEGEAEIEETEMGETDKGAAMIEDLPVIHHANNLLQHFEP